MFISTNKSLPIISPKRKIMFHYEGRVNIDGQQFNKYHVKKPQPHLTSTHWTQKRSNHRLMEILFWLVTGTSKCGRVKPVFALLCSRPFVYKLFTCYSSAQTVLLDNTIEPNFLRSDHDISLIVTTLFDWVQHPV